MLRPGRAMSDLDIKHFKVLLVDEHESMHRILTAMLEDLDVADIEKAIDGSTAIDTLQEYDADLIITGQVMKPMDGVELTRQIRSGEGRVNPFIPIVMISGHAVKENIEAARDAGVHEFLVKPVSAKTLYARLRGIVENPRSFIRSSDYYGPDRRRRAMPIEGPDRRKNAYEYSS